MLIKKRQSATLYGSAVETKAPGRLKSGAAFRGRGHTNLKGSVPLLFLLVFLLMAWPIFAQAGHGGISGHVSDTSGAVIPGAKIEANTPRQMQFAARFMF
jgi:hypothetical protein